MKSINVKCITEGNGLMDDDGLGIGEKRKRRERKRVSISRGLRSPPNKWTKQESEKLIRLVFEFGDKSWKKIAEQLGGGKTGAQCAQHWKRVLSPEIRKGSWDDQEEELLFSLVQKHGQSWKNIAAEIKTRTDIQCRYVFFSFVLSYISHSIHSLSVNFISYYSDLFRRISNIKKVDNNMNLC